MILLDERNHDSNGTHEGEYNEDEASSKVKLSATTKRPLTDVEETSESQSDIFSRSKPVHFLRCTISQRYGVFPRLIAGIYASYKPYSFRTKTE